MNVSEKIAIEHAKLDTLDDFWLAQLQQDNGEHTDLTINEFREFLRKEIHHEVMRFPDGLNGGWIEAVEAFSNPDE